MEITEIENYIAIELKNLDTYVIHNFGESSFYFSSQEINTTIYDSLNINDSKKISTKKIDKNIYSYLNDIKNSIEKRDSKHYLDMTDEEYKQEVEEITSIIKYFELFHINNLK